MCLCRNIKTLSSLTWKFVLFTAITLCMARHTVGAQVMRAELNRVGVRMYATDGDMAALVLYS